MKQSKVLNEIKALLNMEVKLEEMKLQNGTVITTSELAAGNEVFILTDDDKVAMPVGEYILEDGRLLVVAEEGIIGEVRDVADAPAEEEVETPAEITEDLAEEGEADVRDWAGMEKRIQNLEDAIADLKGDKLEEEQIEETIEEEELAVKSRTITEKFSDQKPAAKPIKHNPEGTTKKRNLHTNNSKFSTTLDRVLNKLNK